MGGLLQGACGFLSDPPPPQIHAHRLTYTHRTSLPEEREEKRGNRRRERAKKTAALTKLCQNGSGKNKAETETGKKTTKI